jgi:hypothetical protein
MKTAATRCQHLPRSVQTEFYNTSGGESNLCLQELINTYTLFVFVDTINHVERDFPKSSGI